MITSTPPQYIRKIGQIYYFRLAVPAFSQKLFKKREILWSLKTKSIIDASFFAKVLARRFQKFFSCRDLSDMTPIEIRKYMQNIFTYEMKWLKASMMNNNLPIKPDSTFCDSDIKALWTDEKINEFAHAHQIPINTSRNHRNVLEQSLVQTYSNVIREGIKFAKEMDDLESFDYDKAASKLKLQLPSKMTKKDIPNTPEISRILFGQTAQKPIERITEKPSIELIAIDEFGQPQTKITLGMLINDYLDFKKADNVSTDTIKTYKQSLSWLTMLFTEDLESNQFSARHAARFDQFIGKCPKNVKKLKRFKGITAHEILELCPDDDYGIMGKETIKNIFSRLSGLFNYGEDRGYSDKHYFKNWNTNQGAESLKDVTRFANRDVLKLLPNKTERNKMQHPYQQYIIHIAAYSGMRLGEICQLYTDDIIKIGNIYCFFIRAKRDDQSIKTISSFRIIPIHQNIIDIGFLSFGRGIKKKTGKDTALFPELPFANGTHIKNASRWFNGESRGEGKGRTLGWREKRDILQSEDFRFHFHSFRHSFYSRLNELFDPKLAQKDINAIIGHSNDTNNEKNSAKLMRVYGKHIAPEIPKYKQIIDTIEYDNSDNTDTFLIDDYRE